MLNLVSHSLLQAPTFPVSIRISNFALQALKLLKQAKIILSDLVSEEKMEISMK